MEEKENSNKHKEVSRISTQVDLIQSKKGKEQKIDVLEIIAGEIEKKVMPSMEDSLMGEFNTIDDIRASMMYCVSLYYLI